MNDLSLIFISDIHGFPENLRALLNKLKSEQTSFKLVILGDQLGGGFNDALTQETAQLLNAHANQILAIRGNCDTSFDQKKLLYSIKETSQTFEHDNLTFFITHGHIYSPGRLPPLQNIDIFCSGHTHIPLIETTTQPIIFNPGSLSFPRGNYPPTYGEYRNQTLTIYHAETHQPLFSKSLNK